MTEQVKDSLLSVVAECLPEQEQSTGSSDAHIVFPSTSSAHNLTSKKDYNDAEFVSEKTTLISSSSAITDEEVYCEDIILPKSANLLENIRMVESPPPHCVDSKQLSATTNLSTEDATIFREKSRSGDCGQDESQESLPQCILASDSSIKDMLLLEEVHEQQKCVAPSRPSHVRQQKQTENRKKETNTRISAKDMKIASEKNKTRKIKEAEKLSMHIRRDVIEIDDSSDSSDSESSSTVSHDNDDSDNGSLSDRSELNETKTYEPRTKGELTIDDLPPIEDLQITVSENQCKPVGSISQIVNKMVVIQSLPHTPPLDIDTVLFVDRGQRAIGKIFDVFGPVEEPLYCIRFNSAEHVVEKKIAKEQMVYCAPDTEYTSYIHTSELMKNKGSDASWMDNNEPPISSLDFSDDEDEARHKRTLKKGNAGVKRDYRVDDEFVKKMNQRNLELTAKRKKEDEVKHKHGSSSRRPMVHPSSQNENTIGPAMNSQSFTPVSEGHRVKTKTFTNSEQTSHATQYYNVATAATSTPPHLPKFDTPVRSGNFMYSGYSGPPPPPPPVTTYSFQPQPHYVCAPHHMHRGPPLQNYLTMYTHTPIPSQAVMGPPFSNFTSSAVTALPTYPTQPPLPPSRIPATTILPPMPPPSYTNYAPLRTAPLPSTGLPQTTTYFHCTQNSHQTAPGLIHMNVNSPFHPQFVLPPPSMPPQQTQQHQRGDVVVAAHPERRLQQHPTTNLFYHNPHYKS